MTTYPEKPSARRRPMDKPRTVRVPDDIWNAASDAAAANSTTLSQIVRDSLATYTRRNTPREQATP